MTPSLKAFLLSIFGFLFLIAFPIVVILIIVSVTDQISRF